MYISILYACNGPCALSCIEKWHKKVYIIIYYYYYYVTLSVGLSLYTCAGSEPGLSHGAVAAIIIVSIIVLAVSGTAILLYVRQRQGRMATLGEMNFTNILFKRHSAAQGTESTEAKREEVNLGEITVTGGNTDPSGGEGTADGAAAGAAEADA